MLAMNMDVAVCFTNVRRSVSPFLFPLIPNSLPAILERELQGTLEDPCAIVVGSRCDLAKVWGGQGRGFPDEPIALRGGKVWVIQKVVGLKSKVHSKSTVQEKVAAQSNIRPQKARSAKSISPDIPECSGCILCERRCIQELRIRRRPAQYLVMRIHGSLAGQVRSIIPGVCKRVIHA